MYFAALTYVAGVAALLGFLDAVAAAESALDSPWLVADFSFNWTPPGVNVSVPTTAQCDVINITWTPANNGSPDPVPPYYLQVYTSTSIQPLIVDAGTFSPFQWTVPFAPETQYQICMFDSEGNTGGCQDSYTVIPPTNSTRKCNTTPTPSKALSVVGVTETGPLTQYGWPDQCTTLSLMAQNGTPPFIMTVAPSLHPPLNLTFNDMSPINWTITLSWGTRFWISLVDSLGATWTYGPLHSGGNGPTDCLRLAGNSLVTQPSTPKSSKHVSAGAAVGIAFGALIFGILFTLLAEWLLARIRRRRSPSDDPQGEDAPAMTQASPGRSTSGVDPYPIRAMRSQQQLGDARSSEADTHPITSDLARNDSQLYVVHHDAGGAPITIYTGGRDVQELPPHYTSASPEPRPTHAHSTSQDSSNSATASSNAARRPKMSPLRSLSG